MTDADARLAQLCVPPALKPFALRRLTAPNPVRAIADVARRNIARNGVERRITVLTGASYDLPKGAVPQRCDALVHEIMSTDRLSEALLPSVIHAHEELLTEGAPLLPEKVRAIGAVSTNPHRRPLMRAGEICGFDLSAINDLARSVRSTGDTFSDALISAPETLLEIDLRTIPADLRGRVEIPCTPTSDGLVEGVEQCIGFDFPGGATLPSTSHPNSNWGVHFHLFEEPMPACGDAAFSVAADYTPIALALSPA